MQIKNMAYWKSKNGLPGINNDFERGNNLPDGRSKSSPLQKEMGPYKPFDVDEDIIEKDKAKTKNHGKGWRVDTEKPKESGQKEGQYTTYGDPDFYYDDSGKKVNSANIDEGELSTVKKDKNGRRYVEKSSETGGGKLYLDPK